MWWVGNARTCERSCAKKSSGSLLATAGTWVFFSGGLVSVLGGFSSYFGSVVGVAGGGGDVVTGGVAVLRCFGASACAVFGSHKRAPSYATAIAAAPTATDCHFMLVPCSDKPPANPLRNAGAVLGVTAAPGVRSPTNHRERDAPRPTTWQTRNMVNRRWCAKK